MYENGSMSYKALTSYKGKYEDSHATPTLGSNIVGVKSRKENLHDTLNGNDIGPGTYDGTRKFAQPITNKRQRVVTPAAFKVIDEEDEPRSSPTLRKVSQTAPAMDVRETERRVLSGIEPNILNVGCDSGDRKMSFPRS
jgi:hypothetical protein